MKPRIYNTVGLWVCTGGGATGFGVSPKEAYAWWEVERARYLRQFGK